MGPAIGTESLADVCMMENSNGHNRLHNDQAAALSQLCIASLTSYSCNKTLYEDTE